MNREQASAKALDQAMQQVKADLAPFLSWLVQHHAKFQIDPPPGLVLPPGAFAVDVASAIRAYMKRHPETFVQSLSSLVSFLMIQTVYDSQFEGI